MAHVTTPPLNSPFTDPLYNIGSFVRGQCGNFELNYFKCMEAWGYVRARRECDLEARDYFECTIGLRSMSMTDLNNSKMAKRYWAIRRQRMKLFAKGELDRPFLRGTPYDMFSDFYRFTLFP